MYHLWFAILKVPADFRTTAIRLDCLHSDKGGKTIYKRYDNDLDRDPCWCPISANCTLPAGEYIYDFGKQMNSFVVTEENNRTALNCLVASGSKCHTSEGVRINKFIDSRRDCQSGRGPTCTMKQPCTPCGVEYQPIFGDRWSRCQQCSSLNNGKCDFVPGVGPYCFKGADTREVVPCVSCCTEPELIWEVEDGVSVCK